MGTAVGIFAHQEERRIAACLRSLPLDRPDTVYHVLVNGSHDGTAAAARAAAGGRAHVIVHDFVEGGKSRTWNRFIHDLLRGDEALVVCLDGDARILPGSIDALAAALAADRQANAAAGMPMNGRKAAHYRAMLHAERGLFGDLYALSGRFVAQIRAQGVRLPDDLVGDDGLVAALAHTGLGRDADWVTERILACNGAGFLCDPVSLLHPASWRMQQRRMVSYAVRHFQNRIISDIMGRVGPSGLPDRLARLYPDWLPRLRPRPGLTGLFDRAALARMADAARAQGD